MIITVHGYNTDPDSPDLEDLPHEQQSKFAEALSPFETWSFNWFSAILFKWRYMVRAWKARRLNTYSWAYQDLALVAAEQLEGYIMAYVIENPGERVDLFAHSLGSRVVLQVAAKMPEFINRICFINAAERSKIAVHMINDLPKHVKILNVCVKGDNTLDKAAGWMSPGLFVKEKVLGQDGLMNQSGFYPGDNYSEIFLDKPEDQKRMRKYPGMDLRGGGDHTTSYLHKGNHPLYQLWFSGHLEL